MDKRGAAQEPLDEVASYVGMRKISLGRVGPGNQLRPLLNNEFVFMIGFLDQVKGRMHACFGSTHDVSPAGRVPARPHTMQQVPGIAVTVCM